MFTLSPLHYLCTTFALPQHAVLLVGEALELVGLPPHGAALHHRVDRRLRRELRRVGNNRSMSKARYYLLRANAQVFK